MVALAVYSAGSNAHGQLAQGSEEDSHRFDRCIFQGIQEGRLVGTNVLSIAAGANHTLLLLRSHDGKPELWGCGDGRRGQLGAKYLQEYGASSIFRPINLHQDAPRYLDWNITLVAASWESSFVVLSSPENDIILSVGSDDFGDLGVGGLSQGRKESGTWKLVTFGHLLPKNASNVRVTQLKAGPHTVIAKLQYQDANVTETEVIIGWGAARQGQLGPDKSSKNPLSKVDSPRILKIPSPISAFALGNQHSVFLTSEGSIIAFGSNRKGQLSGLDGVKNICAVGATWNSTYLLQKSGNADEEWTILATGSNSNGQLAHDSASNGGAPTSGLHMHKISLPAEVSRAASLSITCGSEHVLLGSQASLQINDDGEMHVFAWGWNEHGNLGLGHILDVREVTRIWPNGDHQQRVLGVWAGCATSWIAVEEE